MQFQTIDEQVAYLKEHPEDIFIHWSKPALYGNLFAFVGERYDHDEEYDCGCLTQIKMFKDREAFVNGKPDFLLTMEIRMDERIPDDALTLNVKDLDIFAEWQKRLGHK